ncbi:MAG: bacillithiol biosynthesis deacetylase BshB1 [Actinomycetota bacterium]
MTEPLDILAVAAHPDDAEVGCGGALLLGADMGLRTGIVDLTMGERSTRGTPEGREAERRRASAILGLTDRIGLALPDGAVGTQSGHRDAVVEVIRRLRPGVILAPFPEDRHPDHAATGRLAREAAFLAGVSKLAPDRGSAHRPTHVYHYMVHHPFTPSFVVDVSGVWARKIEAVAAYESQFGAESPAPSTDLSHGSFLRVIKARSVFHGAMVGAARGEPYHSLGPVPLPFPPGFTDPAPGGSRFSLF